MTIEISRISDTTTDVETSELTYYYQGIEWMSYLRITSYKQSYSLRICFSLPQAMIPESFLEECIAANWTSLRSDAFPMPSDMTVPVGAEQKAISYYRGMPSLPRFVASSSSTEWEEPSGPGSFVEIRALLPVGEHALTAVWEEDLAPKLHALLDTMGVDWTSTDVVRIGYAALPLYPIPRPPPPVVLWIGVPPASLSAQEGAVVVARCAELLSAYDLADVDVEIRESVVSRFAGGPPLRAPAKWYTTEDVVLRERLATTLGLPIAALDMPGVAGTGGFFVKDDGRLLLVTARHAVFSSTEHAANTHFVQQEVDAGLPQHDVVLFGEAAFDQYLESIKAEIGGHAWDRQQYEEVEDEEGEDAQSKVKRMECVEKESRAMEELYALFNDVSTQWAGMHNRILGHIILAPPIGCKDHGYNEDWAAIEVDASKVNAANFTANAIDFCSPRMPDTFSFELVRFLPKYMHNFDRLLKLNHVIPDEKLHQPMVVCKRGAASGFTAGRANNVFSFTRTRLNDDDRTVRISKEWPILPLDRVFRTFSEKGDSGSVVVDASGNIGGLLTGGAGSAYGADITYATPAAFILKRMEAGGLNPILPRWPTDNLH